MTPACVFRVALDTPLKRLFDYLAPVTGLFATPVAPGMRVRVPFGRQKLVGIVMEVATSSDVPEEKLKPILEVLDARPVLDTSALALLQWAADYYHHPIGEVLSTALPKAMRLGATADAREERWSVPDAGRAAHAEGSLGGRLSKGNCWGIWWGPGVAFQQPRSTGRFPSGARRHGRWWSVGGLRQPKFPSSAANRGLA